MKTKFNILCVLMVLAIIGAMTTIGGAIGKEDVDDFKEGYEQAGSLHARPTRLTRDTPTSGNTWM